MGGLREWVGERGLGKGVRERGLGKGGWGEGKLVVKGNGKRRPIDRLLNSCIVVYMFLLCILLKFLAKHGYYSSTNDIRFNYTTLHALGVWLYVVY